jgi:TolB protein
VYPGAERRQWSAIDVAEGRARIIVGPIVPMRLVALGVVLALFTLGCRSAGPAQTSKAVSPSGRLAYVAPDDHIYTLALGGGDPRRVDSVPGEQAVAGEARISRWPTWTADGSRLAFMRLRSGEGDAPATAAVWSAMPDGSDHVKLWESQDEMPVYMAWAPNAASLGVLVQRGQSLSLLLIDPGGGQPTMVANGSPLYFAWSPDSSQLLVHSGGDHRANSQASLSLAQVGSGPTHQPLSQLPAEFRAPAWSSDGTRVAFVAEAPDKGAVLTVSDTQGGQATRLAPLSEEGAFIWSPDGHRLAFTSRSAGSAPFYRGLEVVKTDGSDRARVAEEPVMAFFWSPDASKLAFAAVDRQAQGLSWFVADAAGKNRKQIGSFLPSEEQIRHFAFFDQYAPSHGLWSPDSRYLVYAGSAAGTPAAEKGRSSRVFLAPADGSAEPRVVADGSLGIWPVRTHHPR